MITYAFLKKNKTLNGDKGSLHLIPEGIDQKDNKSLLYFPENNFGVASHDNVFGGQNSKNIECSFITMEHAINKYEINIHNAQLIKIDVEG
jgi:hypothetical protein